MSEPTVYLDRAKILRAARSAMLDGLHEGVQIVRTAVIRSMKRGGRMGNVIVRSKPGEPPRVQTGRLRASVFGYVDRTKLMGFVGAATEYAPFLEFGTRKMSARPYLRPAVKKKRRAVLRAIRRAVMRRF